MDREAYENHQRWSRRYQLLLEDLAVVVDEMWNSSAD